ncbi:protein phosphatase 1 regulatory subunit 1A [Dendropsophus ebraccatus]|uniref:protein phosphatase 1 regulatory subunit 1A n=1 Tax=Dendropsophus ebraccatus TaxID=150705 RepID=UPI003831FA2F
MVCSIVTTHQIRRRRPTPATLVLSSDQSSPEIDEDRTPNPLQKATLSMSPHQRKKVSRTTPTMKELQLLAEHHLCKQGSEDEGTPQSMTTENRPKLGCCCHGNTAPIQASQQTGSCNCFTQDGQQENNSPGKKQGGQPDASQGLCGRKINTDVKETKEKGKQSSHLPIVQDK